MMIEEMIHIRWYLAYAKQIQEKGEFHNHHKTGSLATNEVLISLDIVNVRKVI
jgi:hypothetical protein